MIKAVALFLTVLTGFSGLVYEVTWQKCLAILLGSHSEATAAVLAIFLGGLAAGYSLFGRLTTRRVAAAEARGRPARLLSFYGIVESSIGVYALCFPTLFAGAQGVSLALPHTSQGIAFAIDVVLTALLIGPATVLMGGTIPVLTQALARDLEDATRVHAFVYAFNTAGAFAGAVAAGFFLIPWLGIHGVLYSMGAVNLFAGVVFGGLGLRRPAAASFAAPAASTPKIEDFALYAAVALLLGFAMMSIQTVLIRLGGLSLGASHFTFAMVVAVFVLCIALGSFGVSALPRVGPRALQVCVWALGVLLAALYPVLQDAPYYTHVIRTFFQSRDADFYPFHLAVFGAILALLAVPVGLSGASLPLLFNHLRNRVGDLGGVAGRLYSWNTVGNLLGALLGGYALLFFVNLHTVYRLGVGAVLLAAAALSTQLVTPARRRYALGAGAAALVLLAVLPAWDPARLASGLFRVREPIPGTYQGPGVLFGIVHQAHQIDFYDDDPTTSVAVKSTTRGGRFVRSIVNNGKSDGSLGPDYPTMALLAHLPCLLARQCRSAFVVGWGTGVTAGELGALDTMERILVAEISRGVIEAAPLFDYGNLDASKNPRIEIRRSDAYRALLRSDERFDVITSEPSNPWASGVEMLYSREFLEAARQRLEPGGVYAQWMHLYETDRATVELVMRTYASVFPKVAVWFTLGNDIVLIGFRDPDAVEDLGRIEARMARSDVANGLRRGGIESLPALLAHEILPAGTVNVLGLEGSIHTLLQPVLSDVAARAFFRGGRASLPSAAGLEPARVGAERSLLARYLAGGGSDDEDFWDTLATESCEFPPSCATVLARWQHEWPASERLRERIDQERRRGPEMSEELEASRLERLADLYGDGSDLTALPVSPAAVRETSELFARHFDPALPFRREALARLVASCRGDTCEREQIRAEWILGALPAPAPD